MNRRAFLGAAAAVATLPATSEAAAAADVDTNDTEEPAVRDCDLCGGPTPVAMLDRTTVPEIAPLQADVCWPCQFLHGHTPDDDVCAQCGDDFGEGYPGGGFPIEIEYPVGPVKLPGLKTAKLCGDCAAWIADDINHGGVRNDGVARERYLQLSAFETERVNELEGYR
jgi:hypothetical protein